VLVLVGVLLIVTALPASAQGILLNTLPFYHQAVGSFTNHTASGDLTGWFSFGLNGQFVDNNLMLHPGICVAAAQGTWAASGCNSNAPVAFVAAGLTGGVAMGTVQAAEYTWVNGAWVPTGTTIPLRVALFVQPTGPITTQFSFVLPGNPSGAPVCATGASSASRAGRAFGVITDGLRQFGGYNSAATMIWGNPQGTGPATWTAGPCP